MGVFVARRLLLSALTLVLSSFVVFVLAANAGDPLADVRTIPGPDRAERLARRAHELQLDRPLPHRYLTWLNGVARCAVPGQGCDLGVNQRGQPVTALVGDAAVSTVRLVAAATVLAVSLGVLAGVLAAARRGRPADRAVTVGAFVAMSLPVFWIAVVSKQYVAIAVNDWYSGDRRVPWPVAAGVGLAVAAGSAAVLGAGRRRRWIAAGLGSGAALFLKVLAAVDWFGAPAIGPLGIAVGAFTIAAGSAVLVAGGRPPMRVAASCTVTAAAGALCQFPVTRWLQSPSVDALSVGALAGAAAVLAVAVGCWAGRPDPAQAVAASLLTAAGTVGLLLVDALLRALPGYADLVYGRVLPTIGSQTPGLGGTFWQRQLDVLAHLALPTLSLVVVAAAPYTRYVRAGILEALGQDFIRTAHAKGAGWVSIVLRHALRSALLPICTLAAVDFGVLIGGAVVTETVFGWQGMGSLFVTGLLQGDPPPVMAFFLLTGSCVAVFTLLADLAYRWLDPRIQGRPT